MAVTIDGAGPLAGATTLNGLTIPTTGFGKVLQVVTASNSTNLQTTSTSYVSTGLSASITPASTSNKILVITIGAGAQYGTSSEGFYTLFRGTVAGTNLGSASVGLLALYAASAAQVASSVSMSVLDTPSTISSVTYTVGMRVNFATSSVQANRAGSPNILILMEVSA
jgi:hypothetical protein